MSTMATVRMNTCQRMAIYRSFVIQEVHGGEWEWTHEDYDRVSFPVTGSCQTVFECIDAVDAWHESQGIVQPDDPEDELTPADLAQIDQAWENHKAALPVAVVINNNQPGRTAIIEITVDPPTLNVGAKLYAEPKAIDHPREPDEGSFTGEDRIAYWKGVMRDAAECLNGEPDYSYIGMGCGLEDRGITDLYEAMQYGWDCALQRVAYEHVAPSRDILIAALQNAGGEQPAPKATDEQLREAVLSGLEDAGWKIDPSARRITPAPNGVSGAVREALAEFICSEFDFDLDPVVGAQWPQHAGDDGYRGDRAYVRLQPADVLARARENADRILTFLSQEPSPSAGER